MERQTNNIEKDNKTRSDEDSQNSSAASSSSFECNVCLDTVSEPVVTLCGHLYCWPCLYPWLQLNNDCPVCKAGVTQENVIPVYCRGDKQMIDPRKRESKASDIPHRPSGQRPQAVPRRRQEFEMQFPGRIGSMGNVVRFFPSLFGLQFQAAAPIETNRSREELEQRAFLSRSLLLLGSFVILCLLLC